MPVMDKIVSLAKRRGFIFQGSDIYGGYQGFWDYGPAGTEMKNNIKREWWKYMVYDHENVVGIDAAIIMNPLVWEKSGHLKAFTDPLVECVNCNKRYRVDYLTNDSDLENIRQRYLNVVEILHKRIDEDIRGMKNINETVDLMNKNALIDSKTKNDIILGLKKIFDQHDLSSKEKLKQSEFVINEGLESFKLLGKMVRLHLNEQVKCPNCGEYNIWTEPKTFNLMTEVLLGTTEPKEKSYLRGEITQGAFVNFKNVVDSTRVKIPFGIAQIGKAFRNEITPGNFTFRSREFEQMELEYFVKPDEKESRETFEYFKDMRKKWYQDLGIRSEKLRYRDHEPDKIAHYARYATDLEYDAPFGWSEFEGIHHRGDYDLGNHNLTYKDNLTGEEYTPWVIETSGGVDRAFLFFLVDSYREDGDRIYLKLHPKIAPYKVAVFPLLANKPELVSKAREIYSSLKSQSLSCTWDDRGNIGKRYFAQDEIGTPWCVTIDFESLNDGCVTVRDRDTAAQERIAIDKLAEYFQNRLV